MKQSESPQKLNDRIVVKYTTQKNIGVEPTYLTRNAIGYVIRGEKQIQRSDKSIRVATGDIFFLGQGTHYIENIPTQNGPFEQLVFYFSPAQLRRVISTLDINTFDKNAHAKSGEDKSEYCNFAATTPSKITRNMLISTNSHYEYGGFLNDPVSESIKLTELAHCILLHEDNSIRSLLIDCLDQEKADFERIIFANTLSDKSIEQLAVECGRSLTSFKKEFKATFGMPPHQWYLKQRLDYARMLLNTTRDSISQIGHMCAFSNPSHFIKLFKRNFGYTPASYRSTIIMINGDEVSKELAAVK